MSACHKLIEREFGLHRRAGLPDGREGTAVDRARTVLREGGEMFGCAVAFVLGEIVLRVLRVELQHQSVPRDFGNNAGGGDGITFGVAFDDGFLPETNCRHVKTVHKHVIGFDRQGVEREHHCAPRRAEDIVAVDDCYVGKAGRPADFRGGGQLSVKRLAFALCELLRIVENFVPVFVRQDHRSCNDWTGKRTAAGLVHAGNDCRSVRVGQLLMPERRHHSNRLCLFDLGGSLADAAAEVIELGAVNIAGTLDFDLLDER